MAIVEREPLRREPGGKESRYHLKGYWDLALRSDEVAHAHVAAYARRAPVKESKSCRQHRRGPQGDKDREYGEGCSAARERHK
jgi:hypothetical protein